MDHLRSIVASANQTWSLLRTNQRAHDVEMKLMFWGRLNFNCCQPSICSMWHAFSFGLKSYLYRLFQRPAVEVIGLKARGAVPEPGSIVIARVSGPFSPD